MSNGFDQLGNPATDDPILHQARQAQQNASNLRNQLATPLGTSSVTYPANNGLGNDLRSLVLLLKAGLPIRACAVEGNGGFDTHTDQIGSFGNNIQSNALALKAYQDHLDAEGLSDRVITFVWSEFGRRPEENDSLGTDHGAAGVGFLIGGRATGNTIGEFPTLDSTGIDQNGNVRATTDFRGVYCSVIEDFLNTDSAMVIPGADTLPRYPVVTTS